MTRLGLLDWAGGELSTFDESCSGTTAIRERANELQVVRQATDLPELSSTGLDFSALDHFWSMVDTLSAGIEPSEAQWHELFATPGYRLAIGNVQTIRRDLELAFRPANRAAFDSLSRARNDQGSRLRHLARAESLRDALNAQRDSLEHAPIFEEAIGRAVTFLPAGATEGRDPPLITGTVFRNDGYASSRGIIVDLLYVYDNGLTDLLAHEFHHAYAGPLATIGGPRFTEDDAQLMAVLAALRTEGIADLVDKPYPHVSKSAGMDRYVARYNEVYEQTPEVLQRFDSLLVALGEDPSQMRDAGRQARAMFWSNAHPNGAFLARTIYETFGADSLWSGVRSPFDFLRAYAAAERERGQGPVFSPEAVELLDALEEKYRKP